MKALKLACLTLIALTCGGCSTSEEKSAAIIVIDYSASTGSVRRTALAQILTQLEEADDTQRICVYRMGRTTDEVFSGAISGNIDDIMSAVIAAAQESDVRQGTDFLGAVQTIDTDMRSSCQSFTLTMITDGYDDFASEARLDRFDATLQNLARSGLTGVNLVGVIPSQRKLMKQEFRQVQPMLTFDAAE